MAIKSRDQEFRLKKLSYVDFKPANMDRVLTMLFPRRRVGGCGPDVPHGSTSSLLRTSLVSTLTTPR